MPDVFLTSLAETTEWGLDSLEIAAAFEKDWPAAAIRWVQDEQDPFAFEFKLELDGARVDGRFDRDGQLFVTEGDLTSCLRLALWFRDRMPPERPLLFYDESYEASVPLRQGMTIDEAKAEFHPTA